MQQANVSLVETNQGLVLASEEGPFEYSLTDGDVTVDIKQYHHQYHIVLRQGECILNDSVTKTKASAMATAFKYILDEFYDLEQFKVTLT